MKRYLTGLSVLLMLYEVGLILWLWLGQPPSWIQTHFYPLAWWPLIILTETLTQLIWGQSLLWGKPRYFLILALASVPFWTSYEIINVAIKNWIYVGLPQSQFVRWIGYSIAYASVLPAIWAFLDIQNPGKIGTDANLLGTDTQRVSVPDSGKLASVPIFQAAVLLALAELGLCLVWPKIFYPLAWGFLFFLTEPYIASKNPEKSYLIAWSQKSFVLTLKTIVGGLACGVFWEFLNWKTAAKWVYTLSADVSFLKIFEMPLLGFLGFGAFALCAQSFSNALLAWWESPRCYSKGIAFVAGLIISLVGFSLIDSYRWIR